MNEEEGSKKGEVRVGACERFHCISHLEPDKVTTQSFRLLEKLDIKDIACDHFDEENVVFWENIEQVFPGVKYNANGNTVIRCRTRIGVGPSTLIADSMYL